MLVIDKPETSDDADLFVGRYFGKLGQGLKKSSEIKNLINVFLEWTKAFTNPFLSSLFFFPFFETGVLKKDSITLIRSDPF